MFDLLFRLVTGEVVGNEVAGSNKNSMFNFKAFVPFYIPTNSVQGSLFLISSQAHISEILGVCRVYVSSFVMLCFVFGNSHPDGYIEVIVFLGFVNNQQN